MVTYYFGILLPKTAWKLKNLDPNGGARPCHPLGFTNVKVKKGKGIGPVIFSDDLGVLGDALNLIVLLRLFSRDICSLFFLLCNETP